MLTKEDTPQVAYHADPTPTPAPFTPPLTVGRTGVDGTTVLTVSGEVDLLTVSDLAAALTPAVHAGPVVLDLSAVTFLDSSGINTILRASQCAESAGHRLLVVADATTGTDIVGRTLRLAGADTLLALAPTLTAAQTQLGH